MTVPWRIGRWLAIAGLAAALCAFTVGRVAAACSFQLGFAALDGLIATQVASCLGDEQHNPANGDGLQETSGGLLVWRKADNWTAFTDGYHTWINGPTGLVERLNTERFPWEGDFAGDPRFGVVLTSTGDAGELHALDVLHTAWFIGDAPAALQYAPSHVLVATSYDLPTLTALARQYPGRAWAMGAEPNGVSGADPNAQPATYAKRLHDVAMTLHAADPTALLIGPDVLNWAANCVGCAGMTTGLAWTEAMRAAYMADYGQDLPFDVWSIHTYPLDWQHLPTVDYQLMEQQLIGLRQWLDAIPAQRGKPIWDTELGAHWGYTAYQFASVDGKQEIVPAGVLRADLVENYFRQMLAWLEQNGARYRITRWFLFATYNPDAPGDHAGAISLLDGAGPDARLTPYGTMFAAAAGPTPAR